MAIKNSLIDGGIFAVILFAVTLGFLHISNIQDEEAVREKAIHTVTASMESQGVEVDIAGRILVICKNCPGETRLRCLPDTKEGWLAYLECEEE